MKKVLIDTDILSMFFRNNQSVHNHFQEYLKEYEKINICIITYYEIISGLKHRDARKQLDTFLDFTKGITLFPLTRHSAQLWQYLRSA